MVLNPAHAWPTAPDLDEPVPHLTSDERYLLAAVCRQARANAWVSGHRLGWVHPRRGVAIGVEPGVLNLWWRTPAGRWPTHPVACEITSLDEALHILSRKRLIPGWFCDHGRKAMDDIARICDSVADDLDVQSTVAIAGDDAVAARVWREAARRARKLAGLKAPS